jgi:hypothetical protein
VARHKLETADPRTKGTLARGAAELVSSTDDVDLAAAAVQVTERALATARREYAECWEAFADLLRRAHGSGVSVAELSRITGYGVGFIRPIVLGQTHAPRPQGRRARQLDDRP